jgi:hypothetical protein
MPDDEAEESMWVIRAQYALLDGDGVRDGNVDNDNNDGEEADENGGANGQTVGGGGGGDGGGGGANVDADAANGAHWMDVDAGAGLGAVRAFLICVRLGEVLKRIKTFGGRLDGRDGRCHDQGVAESVADGSGGGSGGRSLGDNDDSDEDADEDTQEMQVVANNGDEETMTTTPLSQNATNGDDKAKWDLSWEDWGPRWTRMIPVSSMYRWMRFVRLRLRLASFLVYSDNFGFFMS